MSIPLIAATIASLREFYQAKSTVSRMEYTDRPRSRLPVDGRSGAEMGRVTQCPPGGVVALNDCVVSIPEQGAPAPADAVIEWVETGT